MKAWKSLLVVLIALWLPVQGYGAVAMPFCKHGTQAPAAMAGHDVDHAAHAHSGHGAGTDHRHAGAHHDGSQPATGEHAGLACNDCGACHLACAPAISALGLVSATIGGNVFEPVPAISPHDFYPERLQRPPLPAPL
jgi:hypothetical protein